MRTQDARYREETHGPVNRRKPGDKDFNGPPKGLDFPSSRDSADAKADDMSSRSICCAIGNADASRWLQ